MSRMPRSPRPQSLSSPQERIRPLPEGLQRVIYDEVRFALRHTSRPFDELSSIAIASTVACRVVARLSPDRRRT